MKFLRFFVVILAIVVLETQSEDFKKSQLRRRLTGNYDSNQYANDGGGAGEGFTVGGGAGLAEDGNLNDANEIEGSDGGERVASLFETIPGRPQQDYPTYRSIPKTGFTCKGRVNWGYYADVETECQVFHVCESEYSKISFLCPLGSAFNQKHLVCDWWYNFDCNEEISLTSLYDDYDLSLINERDSPESGQHRRHGDNRDNRSTLQFNPGYALRTDRKELKDVEEDEDYYANDDLNLVSSGGNI